jgi:hypothetical protein
VLTVTGAIRREKKRMSKPTDKPTDKPTAATTAPTAPTVHGSADAGATARKPTLEARITALEIKSFGHAPYAGPAEAE